MKYGLIGEHLGHSFSKIIHEKIGDYVYEIKEIQPSLVENFFNEREFSAINVTIPYKQTVMPLLDFIDPHATKIGAVNTVVNHEGKLWGYNTDYMGLCALINKLGAEIKDKRALIIGTGGTSKTATAVLLDMGIKEIIYLSSHNKEGAVSLDEVYKSYTDVDVIFNTSPVGMFPNNDGSPVDLSRFENLKCVVDVIYNPLETNLVKAAKKRGVPAIGGLYMLCSQAVFAYEHFTGKKSQVGLIDKIYNEILSDKKNIVLVGMPSSGKSTVGKELSIKTGKELIDTDEEIIKAEGTDIAYIFKQKGEAYFRDLESKIIKDVSKLNGKIIATGGGAILREENVSALLQNGEIFFIDRSPKNLIPTSTRPLASDREAIINRYHERYNIYKSVSDKIVNGDQTVSEVANDILEEFNK